MSISKNFLQNHKFKLQFGILPNLELFCKKAPIPGVRLPPVNTPSPFTTIPKPGDHLEYEMLTLSFLIDENLANYKEIYQWLLKLGRPQDYKQRREIVISERMNIKDLVSEISVWSLKNSNTPNKLITFHDAFPNELSGIDFDLDQDEAVPMYANVTFSYTYYDFSEG